MNMKLNKILNNIIKPIEIAPDGFLLAAGASALNYFFDIDKGFPYVLYAVSSEQYLKGILAYHKTSRHIKNNSEYLLQN